MRRRLIILHPARPAFRRGTRRALRRCLRRPHHRGPRHVLKDTGPSLRDICSLLSRYLRLSKAYDKKWHPPSRFKTLCTPEEFRRRLEADLDRAYGDHSPFGQPQAIQSPLPAVSPHPVPPASERTPQRSAGESDGKSSLNLQPAQKRDVMSVPLIRRPNGLLSLDWNHARPA